MSFSQLNEELGTVESLNEFECCVLCAGIQLWGDDGYRGNCVQLLEELETI